MSAKFERRIRSEIDTINKGDNKLEQVTIIPNPNNLRLVDIYIEGPVNTPYEGGVFALQFFIPEKYPMEAPICYFVTKIWHPNIDYLGRICLDVLADKWSPALQISTTALSILLLLQTPNPQDPLDNTIAQQFQQDPEGAEAKARAWTKKYANVKIPQRK